MLNHGQDHCKHANSLTVDNMLVIELVIVGLAYLLHAYFPRFCENYAWLYTFSSTGFELINKIWIGIIIGIVSVGLLGQIPREFIISVLGRGGSLKGILRATLAGLFLDICNHGILMVGMKLYKKGASIGQVVAFLVASPWNSFSLTIVLFMLIGLPWTLAFIGLSLLIAIITGLFFDYLVKESFIPANPNAVDLTDDFDLLREIKQSISRTKVSPLLVKKVLVEGLRDSQMVLKWIFLGLILAGIIRIIFSPESFASYFGPSLGGLGLTILAATILEVCSEGSAPIAADLLTRAGAAGNSFAFLMTGVSTDYTEIMSLKDTTKSWKIALFLPLITVPQVVLISWLINQM